MYLPQALLQRFNFNPKLYSRYVPTRVQQAYAITASFVFFLLRAYVLPILALFGVKLELPQAAKKQVEAEKSDNEDGRPDVIEQFVSAAKDLLRKVYTTIVQPLLILVKARRDQLRRFIVNNKQRLHVNITRRLAIIKQRAIAAGQSLVNCAVVQAKAGMAIFLAVPCIVSLRQRFEADFHRICAGILTKVTTKWQTTKDAAKSVSGVMATRLDTVRSRFWTLIAYLRTRVLELFQPICTRIERFHSSSIRAWANEQVTRVRNFWIQKRMTQRNAKIGSWDSVWLEMRDTPNVSPIINIVLQLDQKLDREKVGMVTLSRLLDHAKFRCVVEYPKYRFRMLRALLGKLKPRLREVDKYDEDYHITRHILHIDASKYEDKDTAYQSALNELINQLISTPLDEDKPLWRMHLIETEDETRGDAVLIQLHHFIGDGSALTRLLLSLTSEDAEGHITPTFAQPKLTTENDAADGDINTSSCDTLQNLLLWLQIIAKGLWDVMKAVADLLCYPTDTKTILKGNLSVTKRVASFDISLEELGQISQAYGCLTNDVLTTAVAGALGEYIAEREARSEAKGKAREDRSTTSKHTIGSPRKKLTAVIPYNLRGADDKLELGNEFSIVYLPLPITTTDPVQRLHVVRQTLSAVKSGVEPFVNYAILNSMAIGPLQHLLRPALSFFVDRASLVFTNVPGPQHPLYFAGCSVNSIKFFAPMLALALSVSIFSYADTLTINIATDANVIPDPERIIYHLARQFARLAEEAEKKQE